MCFKNQMSVIWSWTYFYNLHWNNYLYFKGLLYIWGEMIMMALLHMAGLENFECIWKIQRKPEVVVSVSMNLIFTKPLSLNSLVQFVIARNDRWFAYLHIQNGGSKRIWNLTYSWTGNFLLAWAGQFSGIENQTMHRFEQYLKILQLYHENSRFPPSFKFWSVSTIQKHWEEVKKCILHGFQDIKALFLQSPF